MENRSKDFTYEKTREDFRRLIYDLMNGSIDLEAFPVMESKYVKNEYEKGSVCDGLYSEAYNIKLRLFKRLQSEGDNDVERFMDILMEIGEMMSLKMFDYGWFFALNADKISGIA